MDDLLAEAQDNETMEDSLLGQPKADDFTPEALDNYIHTNILLPRNGEM